MLRILRVVRLFPVLVLIFLASPSSATLLLHREKPLSDLRFVPAPWESGEVRAASNGTDFLVVWRSRGAARVRADGELLDVPSLLLPTPERATDMDVVWNGSDYVVAWATYAWPDAPSRLVFATVSSTGEVRQSLPSIPTEAKPQNGAMRLAWNGSVFAAAYQLEAGRVALTLFTPAGAVIRTIHFDGWVPQELINRGSDFALSLGNSLVLLTTNGEVLRNIPVTALDMTTDGDDYLVVGVESVPQSSNGFLVTTRVARDGTVLSTRRLTDNPERIHVASATYADGSYYVAWKSFRGQILFPMQNYSLDLRLARLSVSNEMFESELVAAALDAVSRFVPSPRAPELVANGRRALLFWSQGVYGAGLYGGKILATPLLNGITGPTTTVATKAVDEMPVAVTASAENYLVLTFEEDGSLMARRVSREGKVLDPAGITVSNDVRGWVAASFDAKTSVVVWWSSHGIVGARIAPDGTVLDQPPFRIASAVAEPRIACSSEECAVGWIEGSDVRKLRVARIRDGVVLDPGGIFVAESSVFAMASSGESILLVTLRPGIPGGSILAAVQVTNSDGSSSLRSADFAASVKLYRHLSLLWDGQRYVAFWWERIHEGAGILRASRLDRAGNSLDGPETSWAGLEVMRVGQGIAAVMIGGKIAALFGGNILILAPDTLIEEQRVPVGAEPITLLFGHPDGTGIITYRRYVEEPRFYRAYRAFFRMMDGPVRGRGARR